MNEVSQCNFEVVESDSWTTTCDSISTISWILSHESTASDEIMKEKMTSLHTARFLQISFLLFTHFEEIICFPEYELCLSFFWIKHLLAHFPRSLK